MKKLLVTLLFACAVSMSFANPPVNEKVLKQFASAFPAISDARWFESENHYDVYFEKDETRYHIRYQRNGKILSTRNYYPGHKLCTFLRAKVAEKFRDKSIFGVTELITSDNRIYVIVLEDDATWTNVYADATGQLTVLDTFNKSN